MGNIINGPYHFTSLALHGSLSYRLMIGLVFDSQISKLGYTYVDLPAFLKNGKYICDFFSNSKLQPPVIEWWDHCLKSDQ